MAQLRRLMKSFWLFSLVVLLCWSCANNSPSPISTSTSNITAASDCRMIYHDAGQTEICGQPTKVAALSPHILDMMLSLDEEPVGYSEADMTAQMLRRPKFDNPAEQIPIVGDRIIGTPVNLGDRKNPSLEVLTRLNPALILGEAWQGTNGRYELFSQIAPTVLLDDERGWTRTLPTIAQIFDKRAQQEQIIADYESRVANARQELSSVVKKYPNALVISSGDLSSAIYPYSNSEYTRLLESLGFQLISVENNIPEGASQLSMEALSQFEMDILMVVAWEASDEEGPDDWKNRQREWNETPLLKNMPVSKAGRVYFVDAYPSTLRGPIAAEEILEDYLEYLRPLIQENKASRA